MKKFCFISFVISLLFLYIAGFAFADQLIVPGDRIGKIRLGMDLNEVRGILGEPDREPSKTNDGLLEYQYMKSHLLILDIDPGTKKVMMLATGLVSSYKTSDGLQIGASLENVQSVMGKTKKIRLSQNSFTLKYPGKGIEFIFREKGGNESVFIILVRNKR